jgi:hypothetical protein
MTAAKVIPEGAPKPQDHKPKKSAAARQAEVDGFSTIEQCGVTLRIPAGENVPVKAVLRFRGLNDDLTPIDDDDEKIKAEMMGTRELLGPDQWLALLDKNPTAGDFAAIGKKIIGLLGN